MKIRICDCKNGHSSKPEGYERSVMNKVNCKEVTIKELANAIEKGRTFGIAEFKEDCSMNNSSVISVSLIGFDIDNEYVKEGTKKALPKEYQTHLMGFIRRFAVNFGAKPILSYNTFSHSDDCEKFRVLYLLNRPVTSEEYSTIYKYIADNLRMHYKDLPILDIQCKDASRMFYGTNKQVKVYDDPIPLNVDDILSKIPKEQLRDQKIDDKEIDWASSRNCSMLNKLQSDLSKGNIKATYEVIMKQANLYNIVYCGPTNKGMLSDSELENIVNSVIGYINNGSFKIKKQPKEMKIKQRWNTETSLDYFNRKKEMLRDPWLINYLIPKDCIGLLTAPEKSNKSTLAYWIALCLAARNECIGYEVKNNIKVLYIVAEGGIYNFIEKFGHSENIVVREDYTVDLLNDFDLFKDLITEENIQFVIFDSLYNCGVDISDGKAVQPLLTKLGELCKDKRIGILFTHHLQRGALKAEEVDADFTAGSKNLNRYSSYQINLLRDKRDNEILEECEDDLMFNNMPRHYILQKLNYRLPCGIDKLLLTIKFNDGMINGERYKPDFKGKEDPEDRLQELTNMARCLIEEGYSNFTKKDLSEKLAEEHGAIKAKTVRDKYIIDIIESLLNEGIIIKDKGFYYIRNQDYFTNEPRETNIIDVDFKDIKNSLIIK